MGKLEHFEKFFQIHPYIVLLSNILIIQIVKLKYFGPLDKVR